MQSKAIDVDTKLETESQWLISESIGSEKNLAHVYGWEFANNSTVWPKTNELFIRGKKYVLRVNF